MLLCQGLTPAGAAGWLNAQTGCDRLQVAQEQTQTAEDAALSFVAGAKASQLMQEMLTKEMVRAPACRVVHTSQSQPSRGTCWQPCQSLDPWLTRLPRPGHQALLLWMLCRRNGKTSRATCTVAASPPCRWAFVDMCSSCSFAIEGLWVYSCASMASQCHCCTGGTVSAPNLCLGQSCTSTGCRGTGAGVPSCNGHGGPR